MTKRLLFLVAFVAFAALICTNPAVAQTDKTNVLNVTASVAANCRISSVADIGFGAYDPTDSNNLDAAGNMIFRCVKNTPYKTFIAGARVMNSSPATDPLNFQLYNDPGRAAGAVYPSDNTASGATAPSNAAITANIYGRIPALQDVGVNTYAVALTATVEY